MFEDFLRRIPQDIVSSQLQKELERKGIKLYTV